MTVNESESLAKISPTHAGSGRMFHAWNEIRRRLTSHKCALCHQALEQEDHGWYSVWRCRQRHFSEAVLHDAR